MRTADRVSAEKLRGGFYTPEGLVAVCLERIAELSTGGIGRVLEPSAGDGAFLRGLRGLGAAVGSVTAIEPMEIEAEKARRALAAAGLDGEVRVGSAIGWAAGTDEEFDVAIGNPPFVRYQFVSGADREAALALAARLGVRLGGVGNLWIPVLLGALSRLRAGGAFAFVVPAECLTGISAGAVRRWLFAETEEVRLDHFPPGSFPDVLQEVAVLSGRRGGPGRRPGALRLRVLGRSHAVSGDGPWTRYLLSPAQVSALETASAGVERLGSMVAFEVSIVTGANDYFTVARETVERDALAGWARPLLPRIRHAPGLRYTAADHAATESSGARAWLLDFGAGTADPPRAYVEAGEARGLHRRYKCRIREPWFRVPGIRAGELLLSKRCHLHPRVVLNEAGVLTTDTIYRGRMLTAALAPGDVAASFHNSLTLLSAELEGRSFGGGVLELVPTETSRLLAFASRPADPGLLDRLDSLARQGGGPDALIAATDADLVARGAVEADLVAALAEARTALLARRLDRNRRAPDGSALARAPASRTASAACPVASAGSPSRSSA